MLILYRYLYFIIKFYFQDLWHMKYFTLVLSVYLSMPIVHEHYETQPTNQLLNVVFLSIVVFKHTTQILRKVIEIVGYAAVSV